MPAAKIVIGNITKYIICSVILIALTLPKNSYSQTDSTVKISISYKKSPLKEILADISNQTGFMFVYNSQLVDDEIKLDIKIRNKKLSNVLSQISATLEFSYIITDTHIILKPRKKDINNNRQSQQTSKNAVISGYIRDASSHEMLIGATVAVNNSNKGTLTNAYGYYSLPLEKGEYTITFSYLGYRREYININLRENETIDKDLEPIETQLEAISVTADKTKNSITESLNNSSSIKAADFNKYAGLIIGGDLVGILATDHGITRQSDGSAFYNVRGGYKDQNLILIDEAPIYHPSHLFGFYSAVAPEAVNSLNVYTSDFPLKYGGRLSSITDIHTKDGSSGKVIISSEFTPLTNSHRIETPINRDKITGTADIRSSNLRWIADLMEFKGDNKFYDIHAKIHIKASPKDRIYLSYFRGKDAYSNLQTNNNYSVAWQNNTATIRQYKIISPKIYLNNNIYIGHYSYKLFTSENHDSYWRTRIGNFGIKTDFVYNIAANHTIKAGAEYTYTDIDPATQYIDNKKSNKGIISGNADNIVGYLGVESKIGNSIAIKYGSRLSVWNNFGPAKYFEYNITKMNWDTTLVPEGRFNTFWNFEPRVALVYKPNAKTILKVSAEHNIQYLHMLSNSISPFTTLDFWIPSGKYFKPQTSDCATFTATYTTRELIFTFCTYYKYSKNITEYGQHANMLLNEAIERDFFLGETTAQGFETAIEKDKGSLKMKCFYAYTYSQRYTPDLMKHKYISNDNIPHNVHIMAQYTINNRLTFKADFNCCSGTPYTMPVGFYYYQDYKIPYYGSRNNARLRMYHKLNAAVVYNFQRPLNKYIKHSVTLSVYNVYNRKNYVLVSYNKIETPEGTYLVPTDMIKDNQFLATGLSLPGVFPMVSYNILFSYTPKANR